MVAQNEPKSVKAAQVGMFYSTSAGADSRQICWRECVKEKLQVRRTMEADRGQNSEDPLRGLKNGIRASLHACVG